MRADDGDDWIDYLTLPTGSASTITTYDKPIRLPPRAFPPGFHGANPGPSHDEDMPRPRRRTT